MKASQTDADAAAENFEALEHINNWMIGRNLLTIHEDGGAMAAARNITRSLEEFMASHGILPTFINEAEKPQPQTQP